MGPNLAVPDREIGTNYDANVVDLESLARMDAADLFDGVIRCNPEAFITRQVPLH